MLAHVYRAIGRDGTVYVGTAEEVADEIDTSAVTVRKYARKGWRYKTYDIELTDQYKPFTRRPPKHLNRVERRKDIEAAKVTTEMVEEVRRRLQVGDRVTVQAMLTSVDELGRPRYNKLVVPVVSKSRYTFNVRRQGGWIESYSYIDLYRHNNIREEDWNGKD